MPLWMRSGGPRHRCRRGHQPRKDPHAAALDACSRGSRRGTGCPRYFTTRSGAVRRRQSEVLCSSCSTAWAMLCTCRSWSAVVMSSSSSTVQRRPAMELLERQDLPPVAQRIAGQQPQLGQRVEHQARGLQPFHVLQQLQRGLAQLHLGGVEHGVLLVGQQVSAVGSSSRRCSRSSDQPCERATPSAVRRCGFRQRDVQARLDRWCRAPSIRNCSASVVLPRARRAFDQVQPVWACTRRPARRPAGAAAALCRHPGHALGCAGMAGAPAMMVPVRHACGSGSLRQVRRQVAGQGVGGARSMPSPPPSAA